MKRLLTLPLILAIGFISLQATASPFVHGEAKQEIQLVSYFAQWCKPCRKEAKVLNKLQAQGVNVAGINFDRDDDKRTMEIMDSLGIEYPVYKREHPIDLPLPYILPTTYILADGELIQTLYGEQSYEAIIKQLKPVQ